MGKPFGYHAVRLLPRRALTQLAGAVSSIPLPGPARGPVYRLYASAVGADLSECGADLETFPTFNRFFARPLKDGARPIADFQGMLSPADGRVDASGTVSDGRLIQAKGIDYGIGELLLSDPLAQRLNGAGYSTVYLSPADYHRVHAPSSARVECVRYCPGELWPVNGLSVPYVDGLFRRNERVVFELSTESGPAALVMVGATIVGGVEVTHPDIGRVPREARSREWSPEWKLEAGDEVGSFLLGSTIVLIAQGHAPPTLSAGSLVRVGEPLLPRRS